MVTEKSCNLLEKQVDLQRQWRNGTSSASSNKQISGVKAETFTL